jgi:CRISPR-associated protein Csm5
MNIKLQTLTPVHIGDGSELQGNFEYLYFRDEGKIAVIDAEKVLGILGEDNMAHWIDCIDNNKPLLPVIQQRKVGLKAEDVAERVIPLSIGTEKPIRTQVYGGNNPLLPGSSLKGALRTAVWAEWIMNNPKTMQDNRNLKNYKGGWSDEFVAKTVFGNDPNHDIFRLLQVGDASFLETEAYETNVINKYGDDWRLKSQLTQFVEAIPQGKTTTVRLNYNELLKKQAKGDYFNRNASRIELSTLFPLVNKHVSRLLQEEITYWNDKQGNPQALGDYVEQMERVFNIAQSCAANECVIRVGWGSGYRSMTGDWHAAMTDDDYYRLVKSMRPKHPEDLIFPKTTRFVRNGVPLGFLKMSF